MVLFPARPARFHPPGIMVPFFTRCLEIAVRETRVVTLPHDHQGIPRGSYVFHEFYCDDLTCDCRRVTIVITRAEDEELRERLATISYGWESPEFYRKWSGEDDPDYYHALARAELAPMSEHTNYSQALLALFIECMSWDPALKERFPTHYRQFRAAVRDLAPRPPGSGGRRRG